MSKISNALVVVLVMLTFGCQPSMATDYVTQQEFDAEMQYLNGSINAAISDGVYSLSDQISHGLAAFEKSWADEFAEARRDVDDQAALSLALASAPDPLARNGILGISVGLSYLHGHSTAVAMKFGEHDWQLGAAFAKRAFALSAGCRL